MCPAKVITLEGITFYVESGEDIHNVPAYDALPLEDKRYLAFSSIIGTENGFIIRSDTREDAEITEKCPPFILPEGTRIEAEIPQKPSLKER